MEGVEMTNTELKQILVAHKIKNAPTIVPAEGKEE